MFKNFVSVLALFLFVTLTAKADLTLGPVDIKTPDELKKDMTPAQLDLNQKLEKALEDKIFHYVGWSPELPPSEFGGLKEPLVGIDDLYHEPQSEDLIELATDSETGKQMKLSAAQLETLRTKGFLRVESKRYPGWFHVWEIGTLLQKGTDQIRVRLQQDVATSVWHFQVELPKAFFGDEKSFKTASLRIAESLRNSMDYFVGLTAEKPTHSRAEVEYMILAKRFEQLRSSNSPKEGSSLDLRLYEPKIMKLVIPMVQTVESEFKKEWALELVSLKTRVESELRGKGLDGDALWQAVADEVRSLEQANFLMKLEIEPRLESISPGIGRLLARNGFSTLEVGRHLGQFVEETAVEEEKILKALHAEHPVLSRVPGGWVQKEFVKRAEVSYSDRLAKFIVEVPQAVEALGADYAQDAFLIRRDIETLTTMIPDLRAKWEAEKSPAKTFKHKRKLWTGWTVENVALPGFEPHYRIVDSTVKTTDTASPLWRLRMMAANFWTYMNNGAYALIFDNLIDGRLGFRSLFGKGHVPVGWTVDATDPKNPKIVRDEETTVPSMHENIRAHRAYRRELLQGWRDRKDFGIVGKNFERIVLAFKADLWYGAVAPLSTLALQPVATVANAVISTALVGTSAIWAAAGGALRWVKNWALYDKDGPSDYQRRHLSDPRGRHFQDDDYNFFPVPRTLVQGISTTLYDAAAAAAKTVANVVAGASRLVYGTTRAATRSAWDGAIYHAYLKKHGKVPGVEAWHSKHTAGPGTASEYFYQVDSDLALATMIATIESEGLTLFEAKETELLQRPRLDAEELLAKALLPFISTAKEFAANGGLAFKLISHEEKVNTERARQEIGKQREAYRVLTDIPEAARGKIRFKKDVLVELLKYTAAWSEKKFSALFARFQDTEMEASFFQERNLALRDWVGLARHIVEQTFGAQALTSMEEGDSTFAYVVRRNDLGSLVTGLKTGIPQKDLDIIDVRGVIQDRARKTFTPRTRFLGTSDVCNLALSLPTRQTPRYVEPSGNPDRELTEEERFAEEDRTRNEFERLIQIRTSDASN